MGSRGCEMESCGGYRKSMKQDIDEKKRGRNQMVKNTNKGRRNRRRQVREADIDFEGIAEELAKAKPKTIMVGDALERLVAHLSKGQERGLLVGQIVEICRSRGLDVDEEEVRETLANAAEQPAG